jgi:hypothetical protein
MTCSIESETLFPTSNKDFTNIIWLEMCRILKVTTDCAHSYYPTLLTIFPVGGASQESQHFKCSALRFNTRGYVPYECEVAFKLVQGF